MLERFITKTLNVLLPRGVTAGEAMANFSHSKNCPAFGKGILEQADFLQIGKDERPYFTGEGWFSLVGLSTITYIRCGSCKVTNIFHEIS